MLITERRLAGALALGVALVVYLGSAEPARALVRLTSALGNSNAPAIAHGQDGSFRVVWSDNRTGSSEIYYALFDEFGNRRTPDIQITNTPAASSTLPRLGVDAQGYAYVSWRESNNVWIVKLDPQGNVAANARTLSLGFNYVTTVGPDISVIPDGRFVVSLGVQRSALFEVYAVNCGAGLDKLCQTAAMATQVDFPDPKLTVKADWSMSATTAWQFRDPFGDGLVRRTSGGNCVRGGLVSICGGATFKHPNGHGAGIVYQQSNRVRLTSGSGCGTQLSQGVATAQTPSADSISASYSIAVWDDRRNGNADVYYARYDNATLVRFGPDSVLVTGVSSSTTPDVAGDRAGNAFVVWKDDRDGNEEIYFARTPDPSPSRGTIAGLVRDGVTALPIASAIITVRRTYPVLADPLDYVAAGDGTYRLTGLEPGIYQISASTSGNASPQYAGISVVAGGTAIQDLTVATGHVVAGRVRDSFNAFTIGLARVRIEGVGNAFVREAQTNPDGEYSFDVLPGNYTIQATMPAVGMPGPFWSAQHPFYVPSSVEAVTTGSAPKIRNFALQSNTIVLAHGIFSNEESWGPVASPSGTQETMRSQIEGGSLHTEAIRRDYTKSIPEQGSELQQWFASRPYKSARVAAHSMGGLATRWYIEHIEADRGSRRIPTLITLGTPHHGSPLSSLGHVIDLFHAHELVNALVPRGPSMPMDVYEALLLQHLRFAVDLAPSSPNLNRLNYGTAAYADVAVPPPCGSYAPELFLAGSPNRYVSLVGEHPQIWEIIGALQTGCTSDGIVPANSARLWSSAGNVSNHRTVCLASGDATCEVAHARAPGDETSIDFRRSLCVGTHVIDALKGLALPPTCNDAITGQGVLAGTPIETLYQAIAEREGLVAPGGALSDTVVASGGETIAFRVAWVRGGAALSLKRPGGAILDSAAVVGNANASYRSYYPGTVAHFVVTEAEPGPWVLTVNLVADTTQYVSIRPHVSGDVTLQALCDPSAVRPGAAVRIRGTLLRAGNPLIGATVVAQVTDPVGGSTLLALTDDGLGADGTAGDGQYTGSSSATNLSGAHTVRLVATAGAGPTYEARQATVPFSVSPNLDIALETQDLVHGDLWAYAGNPLPLSVTIRNRSAVVADSVRLRGVEDSTGVAFLDTTVAIAPQSSVTVGTNYRSTRLGVHHVAVSALALGPIPEESYANNAAARFVEIVAPGLSPTVIAAPSVPPPGAPSVELFSRAVPTPTRNGSAIEFSLPVRVDVTQLTIFNTAGRLVGRRDLGALDAGAHRVVWTAPPNAAGVYFYRLTAGLHTARGKLIVVR